MKKEKYPEHITLDSRRVKPGSIFVALAPDNNLRAKHIEEARQRGATRIIDQPSKKEISKLAIDNYGNVSTEIPVIGITGTNGKTSVSHFICQALMMHQCKPAIIGTTGVGIYPNLQDSGYTTPDILSLYEMMYSLKQQGATHIVMEVSSHALDQGRVDGIQFDTTILTNITREHLDYHETFENYCAAKHKLFEVQGIKHRLFNIDDKMGESWAREAIANDEQCLTFSIKQQTFPSNQHVYLSENPNVNIIGDFNHSNILAVYAYLSTFIKDTSTILCYLSELVPVPGRLEKIAMDNKPTVFVDFAHTPDALEKVLTAIKPHCHGKLKCIVGCGGDRDRGKRPLMAKIVEKYGDAFILTNDNPRTEDPHQIISDMVAGLETKNPVIIFDRDAAIKEVIESSDPSDMILIAGKGHEKYQIIGDKKIHFDDVLIARNYLKEKS